MKILCRHSGKDLRKTVFPCRRHRPHMLWRFALICARIRLPRQRGLTGLYLKTEQDFQPDLSEHRIFLYALSECGYSKTAFDLLFQENLPSWLYQVNHNATTMWEHWDGIKEDGSFWSDDMNSYNHYAYGAVFSWIFRELREESKK